MVNGSLNSSLTGKKEIWLCNFLLAAYFKDSNNPAFTVDWAAIAFPLH
jgi:hypothetical protein